MERCGGVRTVILGEQGSGRVIILPLLNVGVTHREVNCSWMRENCGGRAEGGGGSTAGEAGGALVPSTTAVSGGDH